ncbi:hypothetical protein [Arthrobacter sp. HY1533]|uniref:hypothetical protein n=1 Tax=Arthrobacter sp. HY1533 TaxID=2970919 RepID=UPI0022B9DD83|nr:hypothetical protein [Arthrobacter sp. HY1533]
MPAIIETPNELIPDPATVAALVAELVEGTWPSSDQERENLFKRLNFKNGERLDHDSDESFSASCTLLTEVPGISFASWDSLRGKFLGVHFHLYAFPEAQAPATRLGHDAVSSRLTDLYGKPIRPWEDEDAPPSIWQANGREIVMHLFTMRDSTLMLSISDEDLAEAAEAEAIDSSRTPGKNDPSP